MHTAVITPTTTLVDTQIVGDRIVHAASEDLAWTYDLTDDTWRVTHELTTLEVQFFDLARATEWTATGDDATTADLRTFAADLVTTDYALDDQRNLGRRALMLLANPPTLLPAGTDVDATCQCGGYLTASDTNGNRLHVDTCAEELHAPDDRCPDDRTTHRVCDTPIAVACSHCRRQPGDLNAVACLGSGRSRRNSDTATPGADGSCCGCCHGNDR